MILEWAVVVMAAALMFADAPDYAAACLLFALFSRFDRYADEGEVVIIEREAEE